MANESAVEAMKKEALAETSPESLGAVNYMLTTTFVRGNKDIDAYTYLLKLVIQHALDLSQTHPAQAQDYVLAAIPMTFNLASNTWPGWADDFASKAKKHHQALGLEAARLNTELAEQAGLGPERRKNGFWILGCHFLAAGDFIEALEAFNTSRTLANEAQDDAFEVAVTGWMHLTNEVRGESRKPELDATVERLGELGEDGKFYADQLVTALGVFAG
jgi:hypothetical protein